MSHNVNGQPQFKKIGFDLGSCNEMILICFHVRRDSLEDILESKKKESFLRKKGFGVFGSSLMKLFEEEITQKEANETCR